MLIDQDFQSSPFGTHVGGPGSDIGPAAPAVPYTPILTPNGGLYSVIESAPDAQSYPTVMTYWDRPTLLPGGSSLTLDFDVWFDVGITADANAFEVDTMLVLPRAGGNRRLNFSLQSVKGQLYVNQKNAWVPVPGAVFPYAPGQRYHHTLSYGFSPDGGAYRSITINGVVFAVPAELGVADVIDDNWGVVTACQLQQSLLPNGSRYGLILDHVTYTWA